MLVKFLARGTGLARDGADYLLAGPTLVRYWWNRAQKLAGLETQRGRGWHSLRRKIASDLMDQPLKVLCELGGWKAAKTVLQCYQRADEDRLRKALASRCTGAFDPV